MSFSDTIGDMITRIRNGQNAGLASVKCPDSLLRQGVLEVLKNEGFIKGFESSEIRPGVRELRIDLKYFEGVGAKKKLKEYQLQDVVLIQKQQTFQRLKMD